jgi:hypothetical protein
MTLGLDVKQLAAMYRKAKATAGKKSKEDLEKWHSGNLQRLETLEVDVVSNSMTSTTRSNLMIKTSREMSEKVCPPTRSISYH